MKNIRLSEVTQLAHDSGNSDANVLMSLLFYLGLYQPVEIDVASLIETYEDGGKFGDVYYEEKIYTISQPDEFTLLLEFLANGSTIYHYCPKCNKDVVFNSISLGLGT